MSLYQILLLLFLESHRFLVHHETGGTSLVLFVLVLEAADFVGNIELNGRGCHTGSSYR